MRRQRFAGSSSKTDKFVWPAKTATHSRRSRFPVSSSSCKWQQTGISNLLGCIEAPLRAMIRVMMRLYVDEVGTDGLTHLNTDKNKFLSITGVAMRINIARDDLEPAISRLKAEVFDQDPDSPIILHRSDIMGFKGPFETLRDNSKRKLFDETLLRIMQETEYKVITAFINKEWMLKQTHWMQRHPYHYLMLIIIEKYTKLLERCGETGDIMPESRQSKDATLQEAYAEIREKGTNFESAKTIQRRIPAKTLKFRTKKDNISGLQLCDLIAHPSHMTIRKIMKHDVTLGNFARKVALILWAMKYDRSPWTGQIKGYGIKHMP